MTFVESLAHKEAQQRLDALQRDTFKLDLNDLLPDAPVSSSSSSKAASRKRSRPSGDDDDDDHNATGAAVGDDDDDDGDALSKKRRGGRTHLRTVRSLQQLLEEAGTDTLPLHVPTYLTSAAARSRLPKRSFCTNCGYFAKYKCTRCAQKYCSLTCNQAHQEAKRCR
jgi:hypothetical protein